MRLFGLRRAALRRVAAGATILAGCGAALAGCGGEEAERGSTALVPAGTKLARLDISVSDPRPGRFRYRAPSTVRGGLVEIRLHNAGKSPRKAQLWRVGEGHSVRQALRRRRPLPRWLTFAGGVGRTRPGGTGEAVQRLAPGRYYVTGAGNERGEVATVRVTGGAARAKLPEPEARLTAADYSYRFSDLEAGPTALELVNAGKEPHHAYFAPMREGRTLEEVRAFFAGRLAGPPPVDPERTRETPVLEGGQRQVTRLDLRPGRYAVLCFVSDRAGGPPHTEKGMVAEVKVP